LSPLDFHTKPLLARTIDVPADFAPGPPAARTNATERVVRRARRQECAVAPAQAAWQRRKLDVQRPSLAARGLRAAPHPAASETLGGTLVVDNRLGRVDHSDAALHKSDHHHRVLGADQIAFDSTYLLDALSSSIMKTKCATRAMSAMTSTLVSAFALTSIPVRSWKPARVAG
jgi:hypothetical protein